MDDLVSTVPMLESAVTTLVWRWGLSSHQSLAALTEVADELGVDLGELAVLVLASEQLQAQRTRQSATSPPVSRGTRRAVSLSVVSDKPVTAIGRHHDEADRTGASWSMRDPREPGAARSRRLGHSAAVAHRERPQAMEAVTSNWPGAQFGLSRREDEIVALLALGLSNRDIAERCYLSINSVKTYIRTAYRKMGVKSRTRAVLWAIDHGLRPDVPEQIAADHAEPEPVSRSQQPMRGLPSKVG